MRWHLVILRRCFKRASHGSNGLGHHWRVLADAIDAKDAADDSDLANAAVTADPADPGDAAAAADAANAVRHLMKAVLFRPIGDYATCKSHHLLIRKFVQSFTNKRFFFQPFTHLFNQSFTRW